MGSGHWWGKIYSDAGSAIFDEESAKKSGGRVLQVRNRIRGDYETEKRETWLLPGAAERGETSWVEWSALVYQDGLPYVRGLASNGKTVSRPVRLRWPSDLHQEIESGQFGTVKVLAFRSKWIALPAGSMVQALEGTGERLETQRDQASLELKVLVTIPLDSEIEDQFYVRNGVGELVAPLQVVGSPAGRLLSWEELSEYGSEFEDYPPYTGVREILLMRTLEDYSHLEDEGELRFVNIASGWQFEVEDLPSWGELHRAYQERKEAFERERQGT